MLQKGKKTIAGYSLPLKKLLIASGIILIAALAILKSKVFSWFILSNMLL